MDVADYQMTMVLIAPRILLVLMSAGNLAPREFKARSSRWIVSIGKGSWEHHVDIR